MKILCIAALATMACLAVGQADFAKGNILWQVETGG
jgi:hypothetical protein